MPPASSARCGCKGGRREARRAARHARPLRAARRFGSARRAARAAAWSTPAGYPEFPVLEERISRALPARGARACRCEDDERELALAMADPHGQLHDRRVSRWSPGAKVKPQVAIPSELDAALERLYGAGRTAVGQIVGDVEQRDELAFDADVQHLKDLASEAPVIRLVSLIITNALEARASDIHIEPFENRLDRALPHRRRAARGRVAAAALLGRGDLARSRSWRISTSPSAGCRRTAASGCACRARSIDLRVSTVPTMHGESVVMRILDKGGVALDFARLGFEDDIARAVPRRARCSRTASCSSPARPARARRRRSTRRSSASTSPT